MLSPSNAASVDDLRTIAKRRLPRFAFDFVDGGAESETNLLRNRTALEQIELVPRYLVGVSDPLTATELYGKTYASPLGIAPMGFLNMAWPGADLAVARLAAEQNILYLVSSASSTSLETLAEAADGNAWFQLYMSGIDGIIDDLLSRAKAAGYRNLVVTVDIVEAAKRDRDVRNGLKIPFRPTPQIIADLLMHPRWSLGTLMAGAPRFGNFDDRIKEMAGSRSLAEIQRLITSGHFVWDDLRRVRDTWDGPMLVKGILHPDDVEHCIDAGCDGIVVSNHGGRQIDYGPAAIDALPAVAAATRGRVPLLLDSGIRRGADIIRSKALGASAVLAGRAFAYGVAADGPRGARKAFDILQQELRTAMRQLGIQDFATVNEALVMTQPRDGKA